MRVWCARNYVQGAYARNQTLWRPGELTQDRDLLLHITLWQSPWIYLSSGFCYLLDLPDNLLGLEDWRKKNMLPQKRMASHPTCTDDVCLPHSPWLGVVISSHMRQEDGSSELASVIRYSFTASFCHFEEESFFGRNTQRMANQLSTQISH